MLGLLSRNLTYIIRISPLLETPTLLSSLRSLSTAQQSTDQPSLTVSYLVDSCGLSPESALSVSKVFQLKTLEKADSVLSFLKNRGFTQTQISYMVKRYPRLLVSNPEKTILPKMEFLMSKGLSGEELTVVLPWYPWILTRSLEKFVIPNFDFWRDLFKSDEQVVLAIKRYPGLLYCNTKKVVVPGLHALRNDYGLSDSNIVLLLRYYPRLCIAGLDKIRKPVEEARSMGFDPSKSMFVEAVVSLMQMKKSTWDRKVEVFRKWGWTKEDTLGAFIRWPRCMTKSDVKINALMNLFVHKLGWESTFIAKRSFLFTYSIEKRLAPRAFLLQIMIEKGLLKKEFRDTQFFSYSEDRFLTKFVMHHREAPELLKQYSGRLASLKS